ncbi:histidine phosphatase family protein [uncultured Paraglaciecola sp.]|uniref:histidine phosphatase family protein n=1 Tax=uncultured Paraglaciecola sp. TaxID=1765024 RepID=UPI0030D71581
MYLCRHGQSHYNAQGKLQGQLESPLTCLGKTQAKQLAISAKSWGITHIISSSLSRAQQTAQICGQLLEVPVAIQTGLEERHYGHWQGSSISQLPDFEEFKQHCYSHLDLAPCAGAESTAQVRTRMEKQLSVLAQAPSTGNLLVISHGDAIDCLITSWSAPRHMKNSQHLRLIKEANNFVLDNR